MKGALEVFQRTRFAFIPILTKKEDKMDNLDDSFKVVTATLAIRPLYPSWSTFFSPKAHWAQPLAAK